MNREENKTVTHDLEPIIETDRMIDLSDIQHEDRSRLSLIYSLEGSE